MVERVSLPKCERCQHHWLRISLWPHFNPRTLALDWYDITLWIIKCFRKWRWKVFLLSQNVQSLNVPNVWSKVQDNRALMTNYQGPSKSFGQPVSKFAQSKLAEDLWRTKKTISDEFERVWKVGHMAISLVLSVVAAAHVITGWLPSLVFLAENFFKIFSSLLISINQKI